VLISPGPSDPDHAGVSNEAITAFAGRRPVLGVCLGHQCIGQVFGGRIVRAPRVMHGKTSKIFHDEKGVYRGVDNPFVATRYHSLVIAPDSMPDTLEVTAKTWEDEIMGVRAKARGAPLEGVQFHPESIMTAAGKQLLANFLRMARERAEPAP
jgi:anthranilate synthase/aminodeoxychorismate synthase-like glutamine amidotransferase